MKIAAAVLALAATVCMGGRITASGGAQSSGSGFAGGAGELVRWSQLPTGYPYASQYFPDLYPEYDSGVADDFQFDVLLSINIIRWWGGYWNSSLTPPFDSPVEIYLYEDDGTGNAPTLPQHISAIMSWMLEPGEYTEVLDGSDWLCRYEFPQYVYFQADQKYWIEIRKAMPFEPYGQYGWVQSDPVNLSSSVQGFDGLGVEWWTPLEVDMAFELIYVAPPALDRSTWADIKSVFQDFP